MSARGKSSKGKQKETKKIVYWWEDPWCESYLEKYVNEPSTATPSDALSNMKDSASEVPSALDDAVSITTSTDDLKSSLCCKPSCKRKTKPDCLHRMCFECCIEQPPEPFCPGHIQRKLKKREDDKLLEEALKGKKNRTKFYHYEDRFMDFGQTVVIWCLKDFVQTKKYREDVFSLNVKEERQRNLRRKRNSLALAALGGSSSSSSGAAGGSSGDVSDLAASGGARASVSGSISGGGSYGSNSSSSSSGSSHLTANNDHTTKGAVVLNGTTTVGATDSHRKFSASSDSIISRSHSNNNSNGKGDSSVDSCVDNSNKSTSNSGYSVVDDENDSRKRQKTSHQQQSTEKDSASLSPSKYSASAASGFAGRILSAAITTVTSIFSASPEKGTVNGLSGDGSIKRPEVQLQAQDDLQYHLQDGTTLSDSAAIGRASTATPTIFTDGTASEKSATSTYSTRGGGEGRGRYTTKQIAAAPAPAPMASATEAGAEVSAIATSSSSSSSTSLAIARSKYDAAATASDSTSASLVAPAPALAAAKQAVASYQRGEVFVHCHRPQLAKVYKAYKSYKQWKSGKWRDLVTAEDNTHWIIERFQPPQSQPQQNQQHQ